MNTCIFCKIIQGETQASIVHSDARSVTFMDIRPINPGHILIVPRQHIVSWQDVEEETAGHIFQIAAKMNQALRKSTLHCEGINYLACDGEAAFQEVFHAHLHVIPRFKGDGFRFKFPHHYPSSPARVELDEIAQEIKSLLA